MKRSINFLFLFILLFVTSGFAQDKKVAVVTFFIDKRVGMKGTGLEQGADLIKLEKDSDFNLTPILKDFHQRFFDDYAKSFPFQLVPENEVLNNPAYVTFKPQDADGDFNSRRFTPSPGYKVVDYNWLQKNRADLVNMFGQYDGIMFVFVDFYFEPGITFNGMGTVKMKAYANMVLINKNNEIVFKINEYAASKKTGVMVGGIPAMEPSKVLPMCESALDELMTDLDKKLPKIIKKADAKL